jgi:hypothetical protein
MKRILGSDVLGTDGELGRVIDVYYDDRHWTVRYLKRLLHVDLTRDQIKEALEYDEDHPSCRHPAVSPRSAA